MNSKTNESGIIVARKVMKTYDTGTVKVRPYAVWT